MRCFKFESDLPSAARETAHHLVGFQERISDVPIIQLLFLLRLLEIRGVVLISLPNNITILLFYIYLYTKKFFFSPYSKEHVTDHEIEETTSSVARLIPRKTNTVRCHIQ